MYFKSTAWFALTCGLFFCAAFSTTFGALMWLLDQRLTWPMPGAHKLMAIGCLIAAAQATDRFWRVFLLRE
ncbi:hypothetical protein ASE61_04220 [Bosea sp. Root670]|nr:hypothetical protein ASE61_04220 [Bosea sp. Root670]